VGTTASFGIIGLLAFMISRRRRAIAEIDLIASWDAFRAPEQRPTEDKTPLEGNIMDGTEEVQSELDESM